MESSDIICPWQKAQKTVDDYRVFVAEILGAPVSFYMKDRILYCSVHGYGRYYRLEEIEAQHPVLCKKVREFFHV